MIHGRIRGHPFVQSAQKNQCAQGHIRVYFTASDRNVWGTIFDMRSIATLTSGSCVELCRSTSKLHQRCHVTRATHDVIGDVEHLIILTLN